MDPRKNKCQNTMVRSIENLRTNMYTRRNYNVDITLGNKYISVKNEYTFFLFSSIFGHLKFEGEVQVSHGSS